MEKEKIINTIKKHLAKAKDTAGTTIPEAQAAMLKAQEMMAKHKISELEVQGQATKPTNVIEVRISDESRMWWKHNLANLIAKNFRCMLLRAVTDSAKGLHYFTLFGQEEDVEVAKEVYEYTENAVNLMSKRYRTKLRKQGCSIDGVRDDYIRGFIAGLTDKFEDQADDNPSWALVMVGVPPIVKEAWDNKQKDKEQKRQEWQAEYRLEEAQRQLVIQAQKDAGTYVEPAPYVEKPLTAKQKKRLDRMGEFNVQQPKVGWSQQAHEAGYEQARNSGIGSKQIEG